jgi:hypothetical protein
MVNTKMADTYLALIKLLLGFYSAGLNQKAGTLFSEPPLSKEQAIETIIDTLKQLDPQHPICRTPYQDQEFGEFIEKLTLQPVDFFPEQNKGACLKVLNLSSPAETQTCRLPNLNCHPKQHFRTIFEALKNCVSPSSIVHPGQVIQIPRSIYEDWKKGKSNDFVILFFENLWLILSYYYKISTPSICAIDPVLSCANLSNYYCQLKNLDESFAWLFLMLEQENLSNQST